VDSGRLATSAPPDRFGGFREVMLNVVQLNFFVDPAGRSPEVLLAEWPTLTVTARTAASSGCRVTVVQTARRAARLERDNVTYRFLTLPRGPLGHLPAGNRWLRGLEAVFSLIDSIEPDIVHVHGLTAPVQTRLLTRRFPRRVVLAQDHASRPPEGFRRRLHRWGFQDLSGVVFTARAQAVPFVEAGVLPGDVRVFEVLETSTSFTPGDQAAARSETGMSGDPSVLWVGRLDDNKDPLTVLEAVDRVVQRLPGIRLWCVYSDAPILEKVERRLADSPGLRERVHLFGPVPRRDIESFYRSADVFTLASSREGSGYALLEALACGLTPLVTAIPSFHRITGGGAVGELFEPGDAAGLAASLLRVAAQDRPSARRRVRAHFEHALSLEAIGRQWLETYQALLATS
jgi:glycosyltransferase involved in cell wall biosynthesis